MKERSPWYLFAVEGDKWRQLRQLSVRRGRALRAAIREQQYFNGRLMIAQLNSNDLPVRQTAEQATQVVNRMLALTEEPY